MIDLDRLKADGLHLKPESDRLMAQHRAKLKRQFDLARAFYTGHIDAILCSPANQWAMSPTAWQAAGIKLSPIEESLWHDVLGVEAVLYPQYPVDRFFVDFGNPVAKVAIECDGWVWHQDKVKDAVRQARIEALGWTVYRFSGSQCRSLELTATIRRIAEQHGITRA